MMLPNELLAIIFSFVQAKDATPTHDSQTALASLALTTRNFLPLAREHLYSRPLLVSPSAISWSKAIKLANTLAASRVSEMVHTLVGLAKWMDVLRKSEPASQLPYHTRGFSSAYSWFIRMLKLCPRLIRTDLFFQSQAEFSLVVKAIESSAATLRSVRFKTLPSLDGARPTLQTTFNLVQSALRNPVLRRIQRLTLVDVYHAPLPATSSLVAARLSSLVIVEAVGQSNLLQLIPDDLSTLRYLTLRTKTCRSSPPDLSHILTRLTAKIEEFSFRIPPTFDRSPELSQYPRFSLSIPIIPLEQFPRFSNLRSFRLYGFVGLSISLLRQLSSSCPLLKHIDFDESFWISSDSTLVYSVTDQYFEAIFAEDSVIVVLNKLPKLKDLNLGYLPTTDPSKFGRLEKSMKERKIAFTWAKCRVVRVRCECGSYHDDEESD